MSHPKVLLFEKGKPLDADFPKKLEKEGFSVTSIYDTERLLSELECQTYDVAVLNIDNPLSDPAEILKQIKSRDSKIIPVVFTSVNNVESAVEAMKIGLYDYVLKPVEVGAAIKVVQRALATHTFEKTKKNQTKKGYNFSEIVGQSRAIQQIFKLVEKAANSSVTVMIFGESGTGKELVSRAIHQNGTRKNKQFVAVNCAAIPETLLESELFGHEEGAFTGAIKRTTGKFEQAQGGSVFLDEIGEMSLTTQAKTLRILQEKEFERVGGSESIKINVRIISSTNKDLEKLTKEGKFREDLYYRISVFPIVMPPLRERREDIPLLVSHFLKLYSKQLGEKGKEISRDCLDTLIDYNWPGNVRELENVIERAVVLSPSGLITMDHLPDVIVKNAKPSLCKIPDSGDIRPLKEEEKRILQRAFEILGGNISRVAKELDISRRTLYRKIKEFGLDQIVKE